MRAVKGNVFSYPIFCAYTPFPRCSFHLVRILFFLYNINCSIRTLGSDPAVKQILLMMNEKKSFIIEDLDDHHLVIKADEEYRVKEELSQEVCSRPFPLEISTNPPPL